MNLPFFYPILDTEALAARGIAATAMAEALLEAGARILQYRHKPNFDRETFRTAQLISDLCVQAGARFVINDRADIAAILDADLHLGQEDLPPLEARKIVGSERALGFSTHNEMQLQAANREPIDYLAIGPIFGTNSKLRAGPAVGLDGLARLRKLTMHPLVAIGGITRATAPGVWNAGADAVAVIADLIPEVPEKHALLARAKEWVNLTNDD
jgi:thiamine-phosphate pyrophosphorylase